VRGARQGAPAAAESEQLIVDGLIDAGAGVHDSEWIRASLAAVQASPEHSVVARPYAAAPRRLRSLATEPASRRLEELERQGLGALGRRGAIAMFRGALLLAACGAAEEGARAGLVDRVFRTGDSEERAALLAVLPALPSPAAYVETAVEACRSNVRDVFEAIACENEYPSRYFSDEAFNQMVMKAVFSGVPLARIRGLPGRVNSELERMAREYSAERRSAGREVPADLSRLLASRGDA